MTGPIPAFLNSSAGTAGAAERALRADPRFSLHSVSGASLGAEVEAQVGRGARRILVAGGDGTIGSAVGALLDRPVELAILPAGTRNHFAKRVGIPLDPGEALDVAAGSGTRSVEIGMVNGHAFLNTCSLGAYLALVRRRDRLRPRLGYVVAGAVSAAAVLLRLPRLSLALEVGGRRRVYVSPVLFVGVGERELSLPGFGAPVAGGEAALHAIVVGGGGRLRLVALAAAAAAAGVWRVARTPHVDSFILREFRVDVGGKSVHVALDGEIVSLRAPLRFSIRPDALTLVAPPAPE